MFHSLLYSHYVISGERILRCVLLLLRVEEMNVF